eukprot:g429.t1
MRAAPFTASRPDGADAEVLRQLELDLPRTAGNDAALQACIGRVRSMILQHLEDDPELGYCQGMTLVAGVFAAQEDADVEAYRRFAGFMQQASNLCTLIAGGDVALSVLMTTSTTLGCIFMTPLICKVVLGAVVPVDAGGIVVSTFQVVLAPIFLGVGFNTLVPKFCEAVTPFTPVVGVISTVLLVGASVAKCAAPIKGAGIPLQIACHRY